FIEVMVAMLIFVIAILAAISVTTGAVRATREAKEVSQATWLLQNVMAELETKLETLGINDGCEKERKGVFPEPNERYQWVAQCYPIDFFISETASQLLAAANTGDDDTTTENPIT